MKIQVNKQNVGLRIKQIRLDKGYTLEEFGELFGASKSNVYRWEQGKVLPNKDRLQKIAKFSDKTVNELLYYNVEEFVRENYDGIINVDWRVPKKTVPLPLLLELLQLASKRYNFGVSALNDLSNLVDDIIDIIDEYNMGWNIEKGVSKSFSDLKEYTMQTGLGDITKDDTVFKATFNNVFNELSIEEKKEVVKLALELYKDNDNIQTIYIEELEKWLKQDN